MKYRALGSSKIEASRIAFGAWAIGGWMWGGTDEAASIKAIHAALDHGITLIDTAAVYGFGLSEKIVGKALSDRRDQAIIATKCGLRWDLDAGEHFFDSDDKNIYKHLGPKSIQYEVDQSLTRLGVDYIDLYQTHWQDPTTPISESMATLMELKKQGKIRAIGACNVSVDDLEEYCKVGELVSAQNKFSMLDRDAEAELLPYCIENNISVLPYSPMSLGLLTGKVGPDREFKPNDLRYDRPRFERENRIKVNTMLDKMKPIADGRGLTLAQLVIAWTLSRPGITHVLCGARNPEQAKENAAAADVDLTDEELASLDAILSEHGKDII